MDNENTQASSWLETKDAIIKSFAQLTNNDLLQLKDKQNEILARLQIKLGKTQEELQDLISPL